MIRKTTRVLALALIVILAACGGGKSPSDAPANVTVAAGDQRAIVRWTQQSGLTYWIFRAVASVITRDNYSTFPEAHLEASVSTPHSATGLNNGETYAFMMNATDGNGPAGPTSPSLSATPRLSGDIWTSLPVAAGGHDLNDLIYGTLNTVNNFYAVGKTASILKGTEVLDPINDSGNTVTWTVQSSPPGFTQDLNGIAFNSAGPTFVAVGNAGSVLISTDGAIWGAGKISSTASPNLNAVTNNGGNFVAVGAGGAIYSGDGTTWTQRTSTTASTLNDVKFLSGQFIVVGDGGFIATSTDGGTWAIRTSPSSQNLHAVAFGASKYISAGAVATAASTYVVVGDSGVILTSPDSVTWTTLANLLPAVTQNLYSVNFGSRFIAVGQGGVVVTSRPNSAGELDWQSTVSGANDLFANVFGLGANVAVGAAGTNIYSW